MQIRFLNSPTKASAIVARYAHSAEYGCGPSYATVRDYCDSLDHLPKITRIDGDLKNAQRPWALKAVLAQVPPPARVLEFGGGEPIVSGLLSELGYEVTLVDPYEGGAEGPTGYELFLEQFPHVRIARQYFQPGLPGLTPESFDVIFSISVLEHLEADSLTACFDAITEFLRPGGASIHCFDFILEGAGDAHDFVQAQRVLGHQARLAGDPQRGPFPELVEHLRADLETFYLSPQGHHQWRGGRAYSDFPFRKVVSIQTVEFRTRD